MSSQRYPQSCALARAAEVLGGRWTLLIIRELLDGPRRFIDLRHGLGNVTASVLAQRLAGLESDGLIRRNVLPPPAASSVYMLTGLGQTLEPVILELIRWGARSLLPLREGEQLEPPWVRLALMACPRSTPTPDLAFQITITGPGAPTEVHVQGGPGGTSVSRGHAMATAIIRAPAATILGLMAGVIDPAAGNQAGIEVLAGDASRLARFRELFDVPGAVPA